MFTDLYQKPTVKSDAYRRQTSTRPAQPMASLSPISQPPPNFAQMFQVLQSSPGITPELLRSILEGYKHQQRNPPVMDLKAQVGLNQPY
jgi:hypothetical protein